MTDQPAAVLSDDERAELDRLRAAQAAQAVPYTEAAAAAVTDAVDTEAGAQVDAGGSLAQMSTAAAEPLPHEATMDAMMAEFRAMSERVQAMEQELGQARGDYAAAAAALGPPPVALYAKAIHDKLTSFRAAHPDAPPGHFDTVIARAAPLAEAAADLINGKPGAHVSAVTDQLADVIDAVERFAGKTHPRRWGKPVDFSALLGDVEDAQTAADAAAARVPASRCL